MGMTGGFSTPLHTGSSVESIPALPGTVSLNGRRYLIDRASGRHRHVSDPAQRPQQDTQDRPGEATLAVSGAWRRSVFSWEHGAGQEFYDRDQGDPLRFRQSRGIDVWTPWQATLLPATREVTTTGGTLVGAATALSEDGPVLMVAGSTAVQAFDQDGDSLGTDASACTAIASDGYAVFVGTTTGIDRYNVAGDPLDSVAFNVNLDGPEVLAMVKGRLIGTKGRELWDVIDGDVTTAHYSHPSPDWTWTAVAAGQRVIYAAGRTGLRGAVYAVSIEDDATSLGTPVVAAELPDGEWPLALAGYLGFVVVGTNLGVRLAQADSSGYLTLGPLLETGPCRTLEPQGRFVWFGWESAFTDASGLGRMDLSEFTEPLAPAYATDLMAAEPGAVTSVVTFDERRWFIANGALVEQHPTDTVPSGWVDSGWITYGVGDDKNLVTANLTHQPLPVGTQVELSYRSYSSATFASVGTSSRAGSVRPSRRFQTPASTSSAFEVRATLFADLSDLDGPPPVLTRMELSAQPAPPRTAAIYVPLILHEVLDIGGQAFEMDPVSEKAVLISLSVTAQSVPYSEGKESMLVTVSDYEWLPQQQTQSGDGFQGTLVLKLQMV